MSKSKGLALLTVFLCLSLDVARPDKLFAEDNKLTAEEVVAKHLQM
jgi:hypothetical protein